MDELSEDDKIAVARARKIERFLSQPFHVAEVFTGSPGKLVDLKDTIRGFKDLVEGKYDHLPEAAFYMWAPSRRRSRRASASRRKRRRFSMATFRFDLVSPTKLVFSGDVTQVDISGVEAISGCWPDTRPRSRR